MNYMTPDQEGGRALSYCYQDKLVYALLADSFEESKKSALDAFGDLHITIPPASEINLYIILGKQPGRKVYITEIGWQAVIALLKEKRVHVIHLEKKSDINATPPKPKRSWLKIPWAQIFTTASKLPIMKELEENGLEYAKDNLLNDKGDDPPTEQSGAQPQ